MAWFLQHPDGSKRGPYASEAEAMSYMGENASYDCVIEEKPWRLVNFIIGLVMRFVTWREYKRRP